MYFVVTFDLIRLREVIDNDGKEYVNSKAHSRKVAGCVGEVVHLQCCVVFLCALPHLPTRIMVQRILQLACLKMTFRPEIAYLILSTKNSVFLRIPCTL